MKYTGSCHCGAIRFEVEGEIDALLDCNCSMCKRRGGLLWFRPASAFKLLTPASALSTYRFNKKHIAHRFCGVCGIAPFGEATDPNGVPTVAINARCIEGLDLGAYKVVKYDGASL